MFTLAYRIMGNNDNEFPTEFSVYDTSGKKLRTYTYMGLTTTEFVNSNSNFSGAFDPEMGYMIENDYPVYQVSYENPDLSINGMNGYLYGFGDDIYAIYQNDFWYMYSDYGVSNGPICKSTTKSKNILESESWWDDTYLSGN